MRKRTYCAWFRAGITASGLLLLNPGCAQLALPLGRSAKPVPVAQASAAASDSGTPTLGTGSNTSRTIVQATAKTPEQLPATLPAPAESQAASAAPPSAEAPAPAKALPISLDTVLRLAEEQNAQVGQARERLREAYAERDVAKAAWLPNLYIGTAFYRHEGGIQNEDGTLTRSSTGAMFAGLELDGKLDIREVAFQQINAQRQVWQQKGELSRITSETLLEAANTYIDLLTARAAEAITLEMTQKFEDLRKRAQNAADVEKLAKVEVYRVQSELDAQRQAIAKLRAQANGASAKLAYLLGLDPCTELVPVDTRLIAFDLVDVTPPTDQLVSEALTNGPGVREIEGLLNLIQKSMERAKGPGQLLPTFEMHMAEGGFGAGPGDRLDWDNRWDLVLQARWNLTPLVTAKDRQRAANAKMQQAHLAYQDLRGKLAAGVQEARETTLSGRHELEFVAGQIKNAEEAYTLSDQRLREAPAGQGTSYSEVLLAVGSIARAKGNYLSVISSYDKAQLRLMVLLGAAGAHAGTPCPLPH
jgi:outer membrane protein TolC